MDLIRPEQRDAAALTLTVAFHDDPLLHLLAPNELRRPRVGRWFFGVTVDYGMRWGRVWVNEDASAVSVWSPPDEGQGGLRAIVRVMQAAPALDRLHDAVSEPHWYLMAIGTRPARRREDLGGALIAAGTSRADAARVPCCLETATLRNVEFFARRGFEVAGREQVPGYPIFGMARRPR
jgi:GNAT superfamily N-acetyltransferase